MIRTFKDVIDAWRSECEAASDGFRRLADDIGTTPEHVKQMRRRDSIPSDYWPRAVRGARKRHIDGVTLELLARLRASRSERVKRGQKQKEARPKTGVQRSAVAA